MSDERFKDIFRRIVSETPEAPSFSELETHQASPSQPVVFKPWMAVAGAAAMVMVVVGAIGLLGPGSDVLAPPLGSSTTLPDDWIIPTECPVTIPSGDFTPPDSHPAEPSDPEGVWYGSDALWTSLPADGKYLPRMSVWWSAKFTDPGLEPAPEIRTVWRLVDITTDLTIEHEVGTNASTPQDGLFMISGFDPEVVGCWEVTAFYKGASLTYVFYNNQGDDAATVGYVPDVVGTTVLKAEDLLNRKFLRSAFDSPNLSYVVCSQVPQAGTKLGPGSTVSMRTAESLESCDELVGGVTPSPNPDYAVYEDQYGRTFYRTSCPLADVALSGGLIAADWLPAYGDTFRFRVDSLLNSNMAVFLSQPGVISVRSVPRNGYVYNGVDSDDVTATLVVDRMIEVTIDQTFPCPSGPEIWNGIPVAFVLGEVATPSSCTSAQPGSGEIAVYFNCGFDTYPNPTAVVRKATLQFGFTFEAIQEMLAGPTEQELEAGFSSFFSLETANAFIEGEFGDGHLTLDFTDAILVNNASTSNGSVFFLAELNSNVFAFEEVESVDYLVNGECALIWEFVQAGPECHTVTRAEWEATQASWKNG